MRPSIAAICRTFWSASRPRWTAFGVMAAGRAKAPWHFAGKGRQDVARYFSSCSARSSRVSLTPTHDAAGDDYVYATLDSRLQGSQERQDAVVQERLPSLQGARRAGRRMDRVRRHPADDRIAGVGRVRVRPSWGARSASAVRWAGWTGIDRVRISPPLLAPRTPKVEERRRPSPLRRPAPSAYERRWLSACSEGGTIAHCPAPFDQPGVFFDAQAEGDEQPPAMCGTAEPAGAADVRTALAAQSRALRACFGKADGAWVEIGATARAHRTRGSTRLARAASCAVKLVKQATSNVASAPDRIVVVNGAPNKTRRRCRSTASTT